MLSPKKRKLRTASVNRVKPHTGDRYQDRIEPFDGSGKAKNIQSAWPS